MKRFFAWLTARFGPDKPAPRPAPGQSRTRLHQTGKHARPQPARKPDPAGAPQKKDVVDLEPHFDGRVEDNGPGKNVLIRNRYLREDTGTHDTLKIVDDSIIDTEEEPGFDPYNTGRFDRSRNWDRRSRS